LICKSGNDEVEVRNKDSGAVVCTISIAGMHCSMESRGVLFIGT